MLTGRCFKLGNPTLALALIDGKRVAITVPAGSILMVESGPTSETDRLVDVVWNGQTVAMFSYDLTMRGIEIKEPATENSRLKRRAAGQDPAY